jgi:flagellar protein FlbD
MIKLTRLNKQEYYLNSDMVETVETTPDTVITMLNGKKFIVSESADDVVERIIRFKGKIKGISQNE